MSNTRVIGIDFGTSTSVVRIKRYDKDNNPLVDKLTTQPVVFNMGSTMVPTLIRKYDGGAYYGYDAVSNKRNTVLYQNFKVDLESADPAKKAEARELTASFFEYLGKVYREQRDNGHLGSLDDQEKTYVSYPVKWSADTKEFMINVAKQAGFANVEGIDEAQAAIQAVLTQNEDHIHKKGFLSGGSSLNILLLDMGAGTTDLVLCKYQPQSKKTEILCTWPQDGSILFGGKETDEILQRYIEEKIPEEDAAVVMKRFGIEKFKAWKETLVSPTLVKNETVTEFSELDNILEIMGIDMENLSLNRQEFEKTGNAYLRKFVKLVNGCVKAAGISSSNVDLVILTGGHSQWYFAKEMLTGKMTYLGETSLTKIQQNPDRILTIPLPQETVAMGLVFNPLSISFVSESFEKTEPAKKEPQPSQQKEQKERSAPASPASESPSSRDSQKKQPQTSPSLEGQRRSIAKYQSMDYHELRRLAMSEQVHSPTEQGCLWYALATKEKSMGISEWQYGFERAAYAGIADAQADLGAAYLFEDGVSLNETKALENLQKAAEQGVTESFSNLGVYYFVNGDFDRALYNYEKAKELGAEDTDSPVFTIKIRQMTQNVFTQLAGYTRGFDNEATLHTLRTVAANLNEDYDELYNDSFFGISESDFWGNNNGVFLTANGLYTCKRGGEYCAYLPWNLFASLSLKKEFYAALSMREDIVYMKDGTNHAIIPFISNADAMLPVLMELQQKLLKLYEEYHFLFE